MDKVLICSLFIILIGLSACNTLLNSPKYQFTDGYYTAKASGKHSQKVYVDIGDSLVKVYPVKKLGAKQKIDITNYTLISFENQKNQSIQETLFFRQESFDIDFLSILFKYRPSVQNFPNQFNTNLNGGLYLGYRSDIYSLDMQKDPLGKYGRQINHFGFSYGGFMDLGATAMNPWVTNDHITSEYDGVIWTKGIAGIIGLNRLTVGMVVGFDHLLESNKQYWIYQGKPWLGVALGLNLN